MKRAKLGRVIVALLAAFAIGRATVERTADSDSDDAPGGRASVAEVWTCSMDPQVRRDGPGTCPFCGMELVPASSIPSSSAPTEVVLSERARALAAVRTVEVGGGAEDVDDSERRRFVARVAVDETRQEVVTTWTAGRIDRLHVRATGARVARGQVVATIYSPEVYGAHQDLLVARRHLERVSEGPLGDAARASVESARERLRLLGFEGDALAELERASAPARQVPVRSPASGTVIERLATQGAYVAAGAPLYRVARLDRVWAKLDAYERDLPRLAVGQAVTLRFEGLTEPIEGRVAFVDPVVDARRRVAEVRVEVPNPNGALRPGLVGEAEVVLAPGTTAMLVPASAVIHTGRRSIVYVEKELGTYEARVVTVDRPRGTGDSAVVPVIDGLRAGERVVVHGAFVLDAELQIRGGASAMSRDGDSAYVELDAEGRAALAPLVEAAVVLAEALAASDTSQVTTSAHDVLAAVERARIDDGAWESLARELRARGEAVARAGELSSAREAFEPLSRAIERVLARYGNPTDAPVRVAHCPMAFDNRGARWVQRGERVDNAYFGDAMRTCGTIEATVAPNERLDLEALR